MGWGLHNSTARNQSEAHTKLIHELLLVLSPWGLFWKNHTGLYYTKNGSPINIGIIGGADIIGCASGIFVGVEGKTGKAVQSKEQIKFQHVIDSKRGIYILARSAEQCVKDLSLKLKIFHQT